jgi:hypothetical protein
LHIGHPFWATVAASALMPALTSSDIARRAIHLLAGTLGASALPRCFLPGSPALSP